MKARVLFSIVVVFYVSLVIFPTAVFSKEVALKDIKSVFLDYQINVPNPYWKMKEDVREAYKNEFAGKLEALGFSVMHSGANVDAVIKCYFKNAEKHLKWTALDHVELEFIHPITKIAFASFNLDSSDLSLQQTTIKEAEDMLLKKVRDDMASGIAKYTTKNNNEINLMESPNVALKMHGKGTLKDLNRVYIEMGFNIKDYYKVTEKDQQDITKMFIDRFKDAGFNIEANIERADIVARCHIKKTANVPMFGWLCEDIAIEFLFPKENFIVAHFSIPERYVYTDHLISIREGLGHVFKNIKECIESGESLYAISNRVPIHIKEPRYIYVLSNREVIYEGKENLTSNLWADDTAVFNSLSMRGNAQEGKRIAVLAYPESTSPFAIESMLGAVFYDRKKDIKERLAKNGIKPSLPAQKELLDKSYGYAVRYDIKAKRYNTNFFLQFSDYSNLGLYIVRAKDEYAFGDDSRDDRVYWRDLSHSISQLITDYFENKGYSVLNLTPARAEFIGMKPSDVLAKLSDVKIDNLLLVPYCSYTRWISGRGSRYIKSAIGFRLCYAAYLYSRGQDVPVFEYAEDLLPVWSEAASMADSNVKFYDAEKDKDGNIISFREGVIDDEWIIEKTLNKFKGYEKGLNEKVRIGGDLFAKLDEQKL